VCVPVHNGAPFLTETLRAVLDQDYPEVTVLVSDDASDDGSEALCSSFATDGRVRIWRQPARLGWVANCNWLLARAESELVCIVSHDDVPEREFLSRLVSTLGSAPDAALAFCDITIFGRWRRRRVESQGPISGPPAERARSFIASHYGGTAFHALVRRNALDAAGGLRGNDMADFAADVAWLGRLAAVGSFVAVPAALYSKRRHDASASHRWVMWDDQQRAAAWALHCRELLSDGLARFHEPREQELLLRATIRRVLAIEPDRPWRFLRDLPIGQKAALVAPLLQVARDRGSALASIGLGDDPEVIVRREQTALPGIVSRARYVARRAARRVDTRAGSPLRRLRSHI
jgi:hypothetical protein